MFYLIPLVLILAAMAYVRLSTQDAEAYHIALSFEEDAKLVNGVERRAPVTIEALHSVIMAEPRTLLVAGGPSEGRATYVTRSKLWGFPDYTTVESDGSGVRIFGRLVFGRSDLGVNAARVDRWIETLSS